MTTFKLPNLLLEISKNKQLSSCIKDTSTKYEHHFCILTQVKYYQAIKATWKKPRQFWHET